MRDISLSEWREELDLTTPELAHLLGVTGDCLLGWERDEASCPFQRMLELAMEAIDYKIKSEPSIEEMIDRVEVMIEVADLEIARQGDEKSMIERVVPSSH